MAEELFKLTTIVGDGTEGFSGDGELAVHAQLNGVRGLALHPHNGDVYFCDSVNQRIRKLSSSTGLISTIAGDGQRGFRGDGGPAINSQLFNPSGIAIDPRSGEIYICDYNNQRIRKISPSTGTISTIAGNGYNGYSGDGNLAISSKIGSPIGIAIHPHNGDVYCCSLGLHRIFKICIATGKISTIAGNGKQGYSGDGNLAIHAQVYEPREMAFDAMSGDLYFSDSSNDVIRMVSGLTGIISTIAGNGRYGFSGDGELAINARFYTPRGIAFHEGTGDLYVCDMNNQRIRKVSSSTGIITTIAGTGQGGFNGDDTISVKSELNCPYDLIIHPTNGCIYFTDCDNNRIRCIGDGIVLPLKRSVIRKYDRDLISETTITCCKCVMSVASGASQFYESVVCNENLLKNYLNVNQQEIVQHLVDSVIYYEENRENDKWFEKFELIDVLFILGLSLGLDQQFTKLTRELIDSFMNSLNGENCCELFERICQLRDDLLQLGLKHDLLDQMFEYSIEKIAYLMKQHHLVISSTDSGPMIQRYMERIQSKLTTTGPSPIVVIASNDNLEDESKMMCSSLGNGNPIIEKLFNDKTMSDITIKIGSKEFYCHKTILASTSLYYETLFSRIEFQDLKDDVYEINTEEFEDVLHEFILRFCYGMFDNKSIEPAMIIPLFKCASFYQIDPLSTYCAKNIQLTLDNYCTVVEQLGNYEKLQEKLIEFGVSLFRQIFISRDNLGRLPPYLKDEITVRFLTKENSNLNQQK